MADFSAVKKKLGDVKARPLILVAGLVLLVGIVVIVYAMQNGSGNAVEANIGSKTTGVPSIRSSPGTGSTQDETYNQLQLEQNRLRAKEAGQTGGSSIPTLVNQPPGSAGSMGSIASVESETQDAQAEAYKKLLEEQNRRNAARLAAEQQASAASTQAQQAQQAQQAFEGLMQKQANELMKRWQPVAQAVIGGQVLPESMKPTTGTNTQATGLTTVAGTATDKTKSPALYKAGDIIFGVLETGINSDEPGPILVRVVSGPLKGAKLIGSVAIQNDKVMLQFNTLNAPSLPNSVPASVVAIDPETARTALASEVDHHYLIKYGAVFAASFMQGVSQAVQTSLQPSFTSSNNTFVATSTQATTKQEILMGLGQVGQQISQNIQQYSPPPTVTVDAGVSLGLLFLSDFTLSTDPDANANAAAANSPRTAIQQTLSGSGATSGTLPAATAISAQGNPSVVTSTTTSSSAPFPGTIGPRTQTQQSTVTTTIPTTSATGQK